MKRLGSATLSRIWQHNFILCMTLKIPTSCNRLCLDLDEAKPISTSMCDHEGRLPRKVSFIELGTAWQTPEGAISTSNVRSQERGILGASPSPWISSAPPSLTFSRIVTTDFAGCRHHVSTSLNQMSGILLRFKRIADAFARETSFSHQCCVTQNMRK